MALMDALAVVRGMVTELEAEQKRVEARLQVARQALAALTALAASTGLVEDATSASMPSTPAALGHPGQLVAQPTLADGPRSLTSQADKAAEVLRAHGRALHLDELVAQINAQFGENLAKTSLAGALYREAKQGGRFQRLKRGMFELRKPNEIETKSDADRREEVTPPE